MHQNEFPARGGSFVTQRSLRHSDSPSQRMPSRAHKMTAHTSARRSRAVGSHQPAHAENRIYEMQVRICKALANPNRLRILDLLGKKPYTVSGLQKELGIPLANVSVQLATLRAAGVVVTEKKGKQVYCSLALPEVRQACHFIRRVLKAQVRSAQNLPI